MNIRKYTDQLTHIQDIKPTFAMALAGATIAGGVTGYILSEKRNEKTVKVKTVKRKSPLDVKAEQIMAQRNEN